MTTRLILASISLASFGVAAVAAWALRQDRKAKRAAFEFGEQIRTALHGVAELDETVRAERRKRIGKSLDALLADEPGTPDFWAWAERDIAEQDRQAGGPE